MKENKVNELAEKINKHRGLYYNHQPSISDAAFDALCDELRRHDPNNAALTSIGAPVDPSEWKKETHDIPMGSLNKVKTPDELASWVIDTFKPGNSIFVTEKLDGGSIEVLYEDGVLVKAITRGDGIVGEDIAHNIVRMRGVKKVLPDKFTGSLRGEIICRRSNFKKYFPDSENPRNTANGTAKRFDGDGCKYLDVLFYQIVSDLDFTSEFLQFRFLEELGLQVPQYKAFVGKNYNELIDFVVAEWHRYQGIRDNLEYDIDGLVVRVNDLKAQLMLGDLHMRPKGAMAFKFPSEEARTIVTDIICQTGNSGRITPVVEVESVRLMGTNIHRASVYNFAYIRELGIDIGAEVIICRAGDVIPRVEEVIKGTGKTFQMPSKCGVCGGPLEMNGENLMCISTDFCPAQKLGRIKNWINNLNVLEWGEALLKRLVESGMVGSVADLYKLSIKDLSTIERMGDKSAKNCYDSLWSRNPITLDLLIGSLSIPMVGSSTIRLVMAAGYDSFDQILNVSESALASVKGLGPVKSESLYNGVRRNSSLIKELLDVGLKIQDKVEGSLTGKSFCFTGTMKNKRKVLENMVADNGGQVKSVSKGLDYLVIDDLDSQTNKAVVARTLGTKLISEDEFLKLKK